MAVLSPLWAIERRLGRAADGARPRATYSKAHNALRLDTVDARGESAGLFSGQPLADARAICRELEAIEADHAGDARAFEAVCEWLLRYSPSVFAAAPGEAFVDTAGCDHLFGGEAALLEDAAFRFQRAGCTVRLAIADTPGAAWAQAKFGRGGIIPEDGARAALEALPVEALRLEPADVSALRKLGLKRIGQLYNLPRAGLTARFRARLLERLDEAVGARGEPLAAFSTPPRYHVDVRLPEPATSLDAICHYTEQLANNLCESLAQAKRGGRKFELLLFRVDNAVMRITVGASRPAKDADHLLRLFRTRFERLEASFDPGFGFEQFRMEALETAPLAENQNDAFTQARGDAAVAALKDRLAARLGRGRVVRFAFEDTHLPECADAIVPADDTAGGTTTPAKRPLRILPFPEAIDVMASVPDGPPARFRWRRVSYRVLRADGPERLADEWWRRESSRATRDYFEVEDEEGRRCWIFREGLYGDEADAPKWYLHGFFS